MDKKKLLFAGIAPNHYFSGQGRVAYALTTRLSTIFDVRACGWGCERVKDFPIQIYPKSEKWWHAVTEWKPDFLFLSHDVWRFPQLPEVRKKFPNMKIVGYFTVDGDPTSKYWIPILDACDLILVPSKYGRDVLKERYSAQPILIIPQGIDLNVYFRRFDKQKIKELVDEKTRTIEGNEEDKAYFSNKFFVFFAGMNQTKKNIGAILDGFQLFAKNREDVFLFLVIHSYVQTDAFGNQIVSDYDISDLYSWKDAVKKIKIVDKPLNEEELLRIYSISDVLLSPSIGEGFGLFALEAMATGAMPILSYYSAYTELPAKDCCFFMQPTFFRTSWNCRRAIVSPEEVSRALNQAYFVWKNCPNKWLEKQEGNWKKVLNYSWGICTKEIAKVLDDLSKDVVFFDPELRKLK